MKKFLALAVLSSVLLSAAALPVRAADEARPDDRVIFDLVAENWVNTKTARVMINVEAAVTSNTAGAMRANMTKSVGDLVKADWRMTSMNRSQDQTGMDRWSAVFEARVAESDLNGLNENVKKVSKPGMQMSVANIDFSPTVEEVQTVRGQLRTQIYKQANEQLAALNGAIAGRNYRIATIDFVGETSAPLSLPMFAKQGRANMALAMAAPEMADASDDAGIQRAEKLTQKARVVLAAAPSAASPTKP